MIFSSSAGQPQGLFPITMAGYGSENGQPEIREMRKTTIIALAMFLITGQAGATDWPDSIYADPCGFEAMKKEINIFGAVTKGRPEYRIEVANRLRLNRRSAFMSLLAQGMTFKEAFQECPGVIVDTEMLNFYRELKAK